MEKHLMEEFKKILEKEEGITDVALITNLLNEWVVTYWYEGTQHCVCVEDIYRGR